jgi:hypothetical protein
MQEGIVTVIVAYAAWIIVKRYAPKAMRQIVHVLAVRIARRTGLQRLAGKLEAKAAADAACGSGCGSCGNCGTAAVIPSQGKQSVIRLKVIK